VPFISIRGANIHYLEAGKGKPIICFHSTPASAEFYRPQLEYFSRQYRVISVDLRGHGESDKPESGYVMADYAADIIAFIVERGYEDVVLVGHSLGALTSLLVAAELPERIGAMLLEDPPIPLRPGSRDVFANLLDLKQRPFETVVEEFQVWRPFITREQAEGSARRLLQTADGVLAEASQDLSRGSAIPNPDVTIPAPTLVIQAGIEEQRAFGSEGPGLIGAVLPNLQIETIPDTSHNVLREKPDEYRALAREWWDAVQPA
jgi:pimeloyl-ACP methyl ester carboxylesterase